MEYREYYKLVDPENWRPSQVDVLGKLLCYLTDCLVVVRTEVELEICLIFFQVFDRNKQFRVSPFYD